MIPDTAAHGLTFERHTAVQQCESTKHTNTVAHGTTSVRSICRTAAPRWQQATNDACHRDFSLHKQINLLVCRSAFFACSELLLCAKTSSHHQYLAYIMRVLAQHFYFVQPSSLYHQYLTQQDANSTIKTESLADRSLIIHTIMDTLCHQDFITFEFNSR